MEDREVLLQLIEDYPYLINSLEGGTNLFNWLNDLREAIGSIYRRGSSYDITENLKFLILYLFNKKGFFIYITKSKDKFLIQLYYTKEDPKSVKGAITVFLWYQSSHDNEQTLREILLKSIIEEFRPSIPKEKEMLIEVIYNCKIILGEMKI